MSTESVLLRRKLETLRSQYQANLRSMDDLRSEYEGSVSLQLKKLQNEMDEKIRASSEKTFAEFEAEYNEFTDRLNRQLNEKIEEISEEYASLKKENDQMHSLMLKYEDELTKELHSFRTQKEDADRSRYTEASKRMESAYSHFEQFSRSYPHDFFEPNAADALLMQMEATKTDFRSGFYEACMANSSNIEFQISMAEGRMRKQLDQWIRYFTQLESFTVKLRELITSEEFCTVKSERFEKKLNGNSDNSPDTFDFWCEGRYSKMTSELSEFESFINDVCSCDGNTKEEKITKFLRDRRISGEAVTFDVLDRKISRITQLHKTACSIMIYIHSAFTASFERMADIAPEITGVLADIRGGSIILRGYRDNDIRNEYIIVSEESGKKIFITIWPVSTDNITVVNSAGIYVEHNGSGTPENLRATEDLLMSSLSKCSGKMIMILDSNCENRHADSESAIESIRSRINEKRRKELSSVRRVR